MINEEISESNEFFNTILSIMKNYNIEENIEYNQESGKYYISDDMEEQFVDTIAKYDGECFWRELSKRLAARDIKESFSGEQLDRMGEDELMNMLEKATTPYDTEFEKNGLTNLRIRKK
jgi:predicted heme/steroid binding protein